VPYKEDPEQGLRLARETVFSNWPLIILHDDARVAGNVCDFLWSTWTRFEPAGDIYSRDVRINRHHLCYGGPIVIDARLKPGFPKELVARDDIAALVDRRWSQYFPQGLK